jgi:hypothetical protein
MRVRDVNIEKVHPWLLDYAQAQVPSWCMGQYEYYRAEDMGDRCWRVYFMSALNGNLKVVELHESEARSIAR